jgi:poly-gamma-glutamate capsule biosynthesis protein CapA/YwtB (metallophosphatase superfamily)
LIDTEKAKKQTVTLSLRESRLYEAGKLIGQVLAYKTIASNLRGALAGGAITADSYESNISGIAQQIEAHVEKLEKQASAELNHALETQAVKPDSLRTRAKRAILVMLGE